MTGSKHLITARFLIHVLVFGILPALVVAAIPVRRAGLVRAAAGWVVAVGSYLALTTASLYADAKNLMAAGREQQEVVTALQPRARVINTAR